MNKDKIIEELVVMINKILSPDDLTEDDIFGGAEELNIQISQHGIDVEIQIPDYME